MGQPNEPVELDEAGNPVDAAPLTAADYEVPATDNDKAAEDDAEESDADALDAQAEHGE